jgi:phage protein D
MSEKLIIVEMEQLILLQKVRENIEHVSLKKHIVMAQSHKSNWWYANRLASRNHQIMMSGQQHIYFNRSLKSVISVFLLPPKY